jgi:hypothetical protein
MRIQRAAAAIDTSSCPHLIGCGHENCLLWLAGVNYAGRFIDGPAYAPATSFRERLAPSFRRLRSRLGLPAGRKDAAQSAEGPLPATGVAAFVIRCHAN